MADKKISELPEMVALGGDDLFVSVDDPNGSPVTKKINFYNVYQSMPNHGIDTRTATVVVAQDGSGDYTTIQAGINALPAGGGKVFIKEGTYLISSSITITKSNVVIQGQGSATIIKANAGASIKMFYLGDGANTYSDIIIQDLKLDGNSANVTLSFGIYCYSLVQNLTIKNIWFYDLKSTCVYVPAACTNLVITNNRLDSLKFAGIAVSNSLGVLIVGNQIVNCTNWNGWMINVSTCTDSLIAQNYHKDVGTVSASDGIYLYDCLRCVVSENSLVSPRAGIITNDSGSGHDQNIISNNVISGSYGIGIESKAARETIMNNKISSANNIGIKITGSYSRCTDNSVGTSKQDGVAVSGSGCLVSGNYIYQSTLYGVNVTGTGCRVMNNTIRTTGKSPVRIYNDFCAVIGNIFQDNMQEAVIVESGANHHIVNNTIQNPVLPANNFYSGIYLKGSVGNLVYYNLIQGNRIRSEGGGTTFRFGIAEYDSKSDINLISNNVISGVATKNIYIMGARTQASENFYVTGS